MHILSKETMELEAVKRIIIGNTYRRRSKQEP